MPSANPIDVQSKSDLIENQFLLLSPTERNGETEFQCSRFGLTDWKELVLLRISAVGSRTINLKGFYAPRLGQFLIICNYVQILSFSISPINLRQEQIIKLKKILFTSFFLVCKLTAELKFDKGLLAAVTYIHGCTNLAHSETFSFPIFDLEFSWNVSVLHAAKEDDVFRAILKKYRYNFKRLRGDEDKSIEKSFLQ